jgi:hypothetical protein
MKKQKTNDLSKKGDHIVISNGGGDQELRLSLEEYKGHKFVDIRRWYLDKASETMKATQKGITLGSVEVFIAVKHALSAFEENIKAFLSKEK